MYLSKCFTLVTLSVFHLGDTFSGRCSQISRQFLGRIRNVRSDQCKPQQFTYNRAIRFVTRVVQWYEEHSLVL